MEKAGRMKGREFPFGKKKSHVIAAEYRPALEDFLASVLPPEIAGPER